MRASGGAREATWSEAQPSDLEPRAVGELEGTR
jgi:hypothetical protein